MRHQQMVGIVTRPEDTDGGGRAAELLIAALAHRELSAAEPGINEPARPSARKFELRKSDPNIAM
jgi:hypothetical protein